MKAGDTVHVLGVLGEDGRPVPCTLTHWHRSPYATGSRRGEWDYTAPDGRTGCRSTEDIFPWAPDTGSVSTSADAHRADTPSRS